MIVPIILSLFSSSLASEWNSTSAAASGPAAIVTSNGTTVTAGYTTFVTYCPSPTTFTHQSKTYTVSQPTTLTLTECGCTETSGESALPATSAAESAVPTSSVAGSSKGSNSSIAPTSAAAEANVAATNSIAAAGILAAVAYLF